MENWQINCNGCFIGGLQSLITEEKSNEQVKGIAITELPKIGNGKKPTMKQRQIEFVSRKRFKKIQNTEVFIRYKIDGKKKTKVVLLKDIKFTLKAINDETT